MLHDLSVEFKPTNPWMDKMPYDWSSVISFGSSIKLAKNHIIFHQNESGDAIYIVKSGRVRLYLLASNGEEKALCIVGQNGVLGECILTNGESYSTSAITASDVELIKISKTVFQQQSLKNISIYTQLIDMISQKYRLLCNQSLQLSYTKALPRICYAFIQLTLQYGVQLSHQQYQLTIKFTHQEMANLLGTSRITIAKNIKWLIENEYISKQKQHYVINDLVKMVHLANDSTLSY